MSDRDSYHSNADANSAEEDEGEEEEEEDESEIGERADSQCDDQGELLERESKCGTDAHSITSAQVQLNQVDPVVEEVAKPVERNDLVNPFWAEDEELEKGEIVMLPPGETQFFRDLIDIYLYPLLKDKIKEEKDAAGLKDLRNRISVAFLLLNAIFVIVVFVMQTQTSVIYIPWPCGDDVRVEPIGFMFMMTFGVIMILQIIGMLVHRTSTFMHIMATTPLQCCNKEEEDHTDDMIDLAKRMGKLDYEQNMTLNSAYGGSVISRCSDTTGFGDDERREKKKTVYRIAKNAKARAAVSMSVNKAFEKRFQRLERQLEQDNPDLEKIQKKLLGGKTAGFMSNRRTAAALQTLKQNNYTVRQEPPPQPLTGGSTVNSRYSADYPSSSIDGDSVRFRPGAVRFETGSDYSVEPPRVTTIRGVVREQWPKDRDADDDRGPDGDPDYD